MKHANYIFASADIILAEDALKSEGIQLISLLIYFERMYTCQCLKR